MTSGILHKAVLSDDLATLRLLREDALLKKEKDLTGFTAIELARYLDKVQCLKVLREWNPTTLKVYLKDRLPHPVELNEIEIADLFGFHYIPTLTFSYYEFFLEALANCPYIFKYPPLSIKSKALGKTYTSLKRPEVFVKWINETIGYGLFSENFIPKGTFVGEYTGKVRKLDYKHPDPNGYCAHYPTKWTAHQYYTIDAQPEGNEMRFINHSDKPNLKSAWANDRNSMHLLFFNNQDISPHTQLTLDYGPDYWQFREKVSEF